ncbi:hypothetical protein C2G38_2269294 [Gigaspora rosea]|uniref:Uncharacterized protein n=1 Tax=Gigaspora rosea TaxID=44941 RepID=A0A397UFB4_9GLOM|nr:hypothetical protein C2G38_2269294 [Gigaspora rosea]
MRTIEVAKLVLHNACIAWSRKVEALRNRISEIKQTKGLLEKKDNKIKEDVNINLNGIEKGRYEALKESKSMMILGDEVDQEELMNDDEKRIDEGNEKNGIVSSIKEEGYQMNVIEFEDLSELDNKEVLIESANETSNQKDGSRHDFRTIAKADDMNKDAEEDKDIVDNVEEELSRIGYDDINKTMGLTVN